MVPTAQQEYALPVQDRFAAITPGQFPEEIEQRWQAAEKVKETISELVQQEGLSPLDGLAIMACTVGNLFGYRAFHGETSPVELARVLRRTDN